MHIIAYSIYDKIGRDKERVLVRNLMRNLFPYFLLVFLFVDFPFYIFINNAYLFFILIVIRPIYEVNWQAIFLSDNSLIFGGRLL